MEIPHCALSNPSKAYLESVSAKFERIERAGPAQGSVKNSGWNGPCANRRKSNPRQTRPVCTEGHTQKKLFTHVAKLKYGTEELFLEFPSKLIDTEVNWRINYKIKKIISLIINK